MIDATIVGGGILAKLKKEAHKEVNNKVIEFAKKQPDYDLYCNFALEGKGTAKKDTKDPDRLGDSD